LPLSGEQIKQLKEVVQNFHAVKENNAEQEAEKLYRMRMVAPASVYSSSSTGADGVSSNGEFTLGGQDTRDPNSRFMASVSQGKAPLANATHILHPETTLVQGAILQATLEPRIVSDLPGMLRAVVSDDVYSDDETQLLIPKGTRLVGQYSSGILPGQNRIFVIWQRLIRPDGIDISLNSPGTDQLGGAGIAASGIDYHFFQQFGTAALLSIIGAGAANIGVKPTDQLNSSSVYREAIAESFSQSAQNTLQNTGQIKPTLYVNQGAKISVFVARDLNFYAEFKRTGLL
jgi:type IV secretion system protein VirB10